MADFEKVKTRLARRAFHRIIEMEAIASLEIDGGEYEGEDAVECRRCGKKFHPNHDGVHTCSPRLEGTE